MPSSADTAPPIRPGAPGGPDPVYQVAGTDDGNEGRWARGVVLVNPASGAPYAADAGTTGGSLALNDTLHPSRGAVVTTDGALVAESNHYGTPSAGASTTVGTASTAVLSANPARRFLTLCNDSPNTIYVDLSGASAVLGTGIRLNANGGAIVLDRYVPTSAITAIATGASSALALQEG